MSVKIVVVRSPKALSGLLKLVFGFRKRGGDD